MWDEPGFRLKEQVLDVPVSMRPAGLQCIHNTSVTLNSDIHRPDFHEYNQILTGKQAIHYTYIIFRDWRPSVLSGLGAVSLCVWIVTKISSAKR